VGSIQFENFRDPLFKFRLQYSRKPIHTKLQSIYSSFLVEATPGEHEATPYVEFIARLVNAGEAGAQMVVDSKFLDVILSIYLGGFVPKSSPFKSSSLFRVCNRILADLASYPGCHAYLCAHPVHGIWPRRALMPLTQTVHRQVEDRPVCWRALHQADPNAAMQRISSINHILSTSRVLDSPIRWQRDGPFNELADTSTDIFDDFVDLLEFSRYGKLVKLREVS
jgi:hypothetical protein